MKYFTMQECTYSSTAVAKGIDNTPTPEIEAHIVESVETLLDPLREAWETHCKQNGLGKVGINISSGYRCPELEGEDDSGMPSWMHVGYKHPDGKRQRGQYLSMIHGKYYPMTD